MREIKIVLIIINKGRYNKKKKKVSLQVVMYNLLIYLFTTWGQSCNLRNRTCPALGVYITTRVYISMYYTKVRVHLRFLHTTRAIVVLCVLNRHGFACGAPSR